MQRTRAHALGAWLQLGALSDRSMAAPLILPLNTAPPSLSTMGVGIAIAGVPWAGFSVDLSGFVQLEPDVPSGAIADVQLSSNSRIDIGNSSATIDLDARETVDVEFLGVSFTFQDDVAFRPVTPPVEWPPSPIGSGTFDVSGASLVMDMGHLAWTGGTGSIPNIIDLPLVFDLDTAPLELFVFAGQATIATGSLYLELSFAASTPLLFDGVELLLSGAIFTDGTVVPEPSAFALLGIGGILLAATRWRGAGWPTSVNREM